MVVQEVVVPVVVVLAVEVKEVEVWGASEDKVRLVSIESLAFTEAPLASR